ncbi:MAG: RusA family crossover junction endodeoxyribonuclease [Caulobacterales bacterium]
MAPIPPQDNPQTGGAWNGSARVRWRRDGEAFELWLNEVTSQTRVYKQTLDLFFRRDFRDWRPAWGDFAVEIRVELNPAFPKIDLDNVAKAVLDGIKGALFFDDSQVAKLLVERKRAEAEGLFIRVYRLPDEHTVL